MNCPRCHSALSTTTVHDVEIETCSKCGGMFLDHGVLDRIAEPHEGDLEFSSLDHETFKIRHRGDLPATPVLGNGNFSYTYGGAAQI